MRQIAYTPATCQQKVKLSTTELRANGATLQAEVAKEYADKQIGLSDHDCLKAGTAMLFPYDSPGEYCYWMKDMNFAIDMVWLDSNKKIITIISNVKPESYPEKSFCPSSPAQYVVEVNAGLSKQLGWDINTQFSF